MPAAVTACPHTDRPHRAFGLCGPCYYRLRRQPDYQPLPKAKTCPHGKVGVRSCRDCNNDYGREWKRQHAPVRTCADIDCTNTFTTTSGQVRFCSKACRRRDEYRRQGRTPGGVNRPCAREGCPNRAIGQANTLYCSKSCAAKVHWQQTARAKHIAPEPAERQCEQCGRTFRPTHNGTHRFCSKPCASRYHYERLTPEQKLDYRPTRDEASAYNVHSRMLALGNDAEWDRSVTLGAVIEHFGGICAYCHEPTADRDFARGNNPKRPTMDHVLPLSKNGPHTWANVVLACLRDNREKWDETCQACDGPITEIGEPICAKCVAKGRGAKQNFAVCAGCRYVEMTGGFCSRCKGKVWLATGLTRRAANALAATVVTTAVVTDDWVVWAA